MKTYKTTYQINQPVGTGDVVKINKELKIKADSFAEARSIIKNKHKGINIKVEEVK